MRLTTPPAMTVPMAAPVVPKAGMGPSPRMKMTLRTMLQHREHHARGAAASARRRPSGTHRRS